MTEQAVLLVEDDPSMAEVVVDALRRRGYRALAVASGTLALEVVADHRPDIVVLDLGLPDVDGVEVCRRLRSWWPNPIIVLSADGGEDRKIEALDAGADDYVTKPFSMPELLARLRVAERHRELVARAADPVHLAVGDLDVDLSARRVSIGGREVELTRKEFDLLALLARRPGQVVTHGRIAEEVWGGARPGVAESVRVHMTALRRKVGSGPDRPRLLAEPGVGYRLVVGEPDQPGADGSPTVGP